MKGGYLVPISPSRNCLATYKRLKKLTSLFNYSNFFAVADFSLIVWNWKLGIFILLYIWLWIPCHFATLSNNFNISNQFNAVFYNTNMWIQHDKSVINFKKGISVFTYFFCKTWNLFLKGTLHWHTFIMVPIV